MVQARRHERFGRFVFGRVAGLVEVRAALVRALTGEPLDPPAEVPLALYPVTVEDGRIVLELPDGPIPVNG